MITAAMATMATVDTAKTTRSFCLVVPASKLSRLAAAPRTTAPDARPATPVAPEPPRYAPSPARHAPAPNAQPPPPYPHRSAACNAGNGCGGAAHPTRLEGPPQVRQVLVVVTRPHLSWLDFAGVTPEWLGRGCDRRPLKETGGGSRARLRFRQALLAADLHPPFRVGGRHSRPIARSRCRARIGSPPR
jgi:hypothetical protein